jgi:sugar O-acyltransferase (sialic acid O-acetyltransferase NeuD family)
MSTPIVIVGAGGFGREVLDIIEAINGQSPAATWKFVGFLDDGEPKTYGRGPILGPAAMLDSLDAMYVIGIGNPRVRRQIAEGTRAEPATLVHPSATMGPDVTLGAGTVVTAGVRMTNHIRIGRHVHLNLNATVGHDARLDDYVTVNPGATISGEVVLETGVTIGTNACVNQQRTVGSWSIIGSGAAAVRDIPAEVVAVGIPAVPRLSD